MLEVFFGTLGLSIIALSSIVLTLADIMGYCNWFIEAFASFSDFELIKSITDSA